MIFNEEMVGGRERVTTVFKTDRLSGCKNYVGKRKKFIFDAFVDLKPVERFENGSDMLGEIGARL